jgi:membrane-associated protease RseP (regulator of RpoE activity)
MKVISGYGGRLLAGVLATSVLLLGLSVVVRGEDKPAKKDDKPAQKSEDKTPKKDDKPAPKKKQAEEDDLLGFPNIDEMLEKMPGLDADQLKEMKKRMAEMRKQMREMRRQGGIGGLPAFPRMPMMPALPNFPGMGRPEAAPMSEMRMGAHLTRPSATLEDQLDLPRDQGLVLTEVGANSAAAKAGLKKHDILLELNGKPVSSKLDEFAKQLKEVKPSTPVDVVVMRKGKKETIKGLTLPEAKVSPPVPGRLPAFPNFPGGQGNFNPPAFGGGVNQSTTVERNNDQFTITNKSDGVKIVVKGKVEDGKPNVSEVAIESDSKTKTYDSLDKVPAEYKEKVEKLIGRGGPRNPRFPQPRADKY